MSSRQLRFIARNVIENATCLIANSYNTEKILRDDWAVPPARIRVLHPGADCNRFVPAPRSPETRQALGWGERPVILTVSRLVRRKGHDRLIAALPAIREKIPNVLYAIVGDGNTRPALEQQIRQLGLSDAVRFHGDLGDDALVPCYQQCDLFVLPNRQIGSDIVGFGMVLVEAQACGKPVIAGRFWRNGRNDADSRDREWSCPAARGTPAPLPRRSWSCSSTPLEGKRWAGQGGFGRLRNSHLGSHSAARPRGYSTLRRQARQAEANVKTVSTNLAELSSR